MVVQTKRLVPFNEGKATENKSTSAIPAFLVRETKKSEKQMTTNLNSAITQTTPMAGNEVIRGQDIRTTSGVSNKRTTVSA